MTARKRRTRVVIMGAAGRDFHNFNVVYRDDPKTQVVAFTAAQIPGIADRRYPPSLAGPLYPGGIPIEDEGRLEALCREHEVDAVVFAYSDVPHAHVMHLASRALAAGADFRLLGPRATMLKACVPVIAVTAVRTGCGKSQIARWLSRHLRARGIRVAAVRHPMPYGDLARERCQRFASRADLDAAHCTNEEREEYEPHIAAGTVVFAGVDYKAILEAAEREAEIIVWDGGNNDFSFYVPDLDIAVVDALRPDQMDTHHPGEASLRMADIVVVNKVDAAPADDVVRAIDAARRLAPAATVTQAASPVRLADAGAVAGKRVLVVEDGPTLTHGGMSHGAGFVAARAGGAAEIVDPRPYAVPAITAIFRRYPHIGPVLPATGYDHAQLTALADTINQAEADVVVSATPMDLAKAIDIHKPVVRAFYDYVEAGSPTLARLVDDFLARLER